MLDCYLIVFVLLVFSGLCLLQADLDFDFWYFGLLCGYLLGLLVWLFYFVVLIVMLVCVILLADLVLLVFVVRLCLFLFVELNLDF